MQDIPNNSVIAWQGNPGTISWREGNLLTILYTCGNVKMYFALDQIWYPAGESLVEHVRELP